MNLQIKPLMQIVIQLTNNLRSKKAAKELLNLTDKQLKDLDLTRDIVAQQINLQNWSVLNVDKVNIINANFINTKEDTSTFNLPINDDGILSVA